MERKQVHGRGVNHRLLPAATAHLTVSKKGESMELSEIEISIQTEMDIASRELSRDDYATLLDSLADDISSRREALEEEDR